MIHKSLILIALFTSNVSKAESVDLSSVIKSVLENSANAKIARLKFKQSFYDVAIQQSSFFPKVSAIGRIDRNNRNSQDNTDYTSSLTVNKNLFDGGVDKANYMISKIKTEIAKLAYKKDLQKIILDTTKLYYSVKQARIMKQAYLSGQKSIKKIMQVEKIKFESGVTTKIQYLNSQSSYYTINSNYLSVDAKLQGLYSEYKRLIGADVPKVLPLPLLERIVVPSSLIEVKKLAWKDNIDLKIIELNNRVSGKEVDIALAAKSPVVDFKGSIDKKYKSNTKSTNVAIIISIPLFNGNLNKNLYEKAKFAKIISDKEYANSRSLINIQSVKIWERYVSSKNSSIALKKAMQASELSLKAEKIRYEAGQINSQTLLNKIETNLKVKNQYIDGLQSYAVSVIDLLIISGKLDKNSFDLYN